MDDNSCKSLAQFVMVAMGIDGGKEEKEKNVMKREREGERKK